MRKISVMCALGMLLCAVSCQKENGMGHSGKGREIKVQLGNDQVTKSSSSSEEELLFSVPVTTGAGVSLSVEAYIGDIRDDLSSYVTKGAPVTTANLASAYGSFTATVFKGGSVYADDVTGKPMSGVSASPDGDGEWTFDGGPYYWPEGNDDLAFCSSAPSSAAGVTDLSWNGGEKVTFKYTDTPAGEGGDAESQPDLIFGINSQNRSSHDTYAWINFSHALTAVKFTKGDIEDCTVESVTLKNFKSSGKATGTVLGNSLTFAWSDQSTLEDYVQTFGTDVDDLEVSESLDPTSDESCTFMMIPQVLDANASIEIELSDSEGTTSTVSVNIGSITASQAGSEVNAAKLKDWSAYAGKVITIRVSKGDARPLSIEVSDVMEGNVKSDLKVENTGGVPVYVRMSIVVNWVDGDGYAFRSCDWMSDGSAIEGKNWGEDKKWKLGSDGWFYYTNGVPVSSSSAAHRYTEPLFTSYTSKRAPIVAGWNLSMKAIVQAVEFDAENANAEAAWGAEAASNLSKALDE